MGIGKDGEPTHNFTQVMNYMPNTRCLLKAAVVI
jgi:hypothetical protein